MVQNLPQVQKKPTYNWWISNFLIVTLLPTLSPMFVCCAQLNRVECSQDIRTCVAHLLFQISTPLQRTHMHTFHAFGAMILIPWGCGVHKAVAGSYPNPNPVLLQNLADETSYRHLSLVAFFDLRYCWFNGWTLRMLLLFLYVK